MSDVKLRIVQPQVKLKFPTSLPGPQGPPGPEGGSAVVYPAGENLSSGRAVIIDNGAAFYFQPANAAHAGRAYGVTISSATTGNNVSIQLNGTIQDAAFGFTEDRILWIGNDGEIQDAQPTELLIQKAGVAADGKKMKIDFSVQILKN